MTTPITPRRSPYRSTERKTPSPPWRPVLLSDYETMQSYTPGYTLMAEYDAIEEQRLREKARRKVRHWQRKAALHTQRMKQLQDMEGQRVQSEIEDNRLRREEAVKQMAHEKRQELIRRRNLRHSRKRERERLKNLIEEKMKDIRAKLSGGRLHQILKRKYNQKVRREQIEKAKEYREEKLKKYPPVSKGKLDEHQLFYDAGHVKLMERLKGIREEEQQEMDKHEKDLRALVGEPSKAAVRIKEREEDERKMEEQREAEKVERVRERLRYGDLVKELYHGQCRWASPTPSAYQASTIPVPDRPSGGQYHPPTVPLETNREGARHEGIRHLRALCRANRESRRKVEEECKDRGETPPPLAASHIVPPAPVNVKMLRARKDASEFLRDDIEGRKEINAVYRARLDEEFSRLHDVLEWLEGAPDRKLKTNKVEEVAESLWKLEKEAAAAEERLRFRRQRHRKTANSVRKNVQVADMYIDAVKGKIQLLNHVTNHPEAGRTLEAVETRMERQRQERSKQAMQSFRMSAAESVRLKRREAEERRKLDEVREKMGLPARETPSASGKGSPGADESDGEEDRQSRESWELEAEELRRARMEEEAAERERERREQIDRWSDHDAGGVRGDDNDPYNEDLDDGPPGGGGGDDGEEEEGEGEKENEENKEGFLDMFDREQEDKKGDEDGENEKEKEKEKEDLENETDGGFLTDFGGEEDKEKDEKEEDNTGGFLGFATGGEDEQEGEDRPAEGDTADEKEKTDEKEASGPLGFLTTFNIEDNKEGEETGNGEEKEKGEEEEGEKKDESEEKPQSPPAEAPGEPKEEETKEQEGGFFGAFMTEVQDQPAEGEGGNEEKGDGEEGGNEGEGGGGEGDEQFPPRWF
uniref:Uncharacterized protein n=1 Tax=Chromera velia CCMP2878 TaxID=1169474 RepID=A0A0G4F649_9ALVE|eukprot:Cvel_2765.t1-p1 / transcript=Cvel_2765.t1 / gene=Cvel_2765 / organism=Chromera_velia_CCMP2878 / gene_product=Trichohyalin, putative / transcript_product=Trichohyalin, putative / location=Cvel_scaffold111:33496-39083(+) / protein_length=872 / sequence_SO=supercontig / SO=protein_coding / is_pseudo=false